LPYGRTNLDPNQKLRATTIGNRRDLGLGHAKWSTFYLIVKNVQSESQEALSVIKWRREIWRAATFPARNGRELQARQKDRWTAEEIIKGFGPELLKIAAPI
ncbi:hypothetical protein ACKVWM_011607, partial [Pyricularia oryzae]